MIKYKLNTERISHNQKSVAKKMSSSLDVELEKIVNRIKEKFLTLGSLEVLQRILIKDTNLISFVKI